MLEGNPISVDNLHRQLTSPIDVLKNTIGNTPLAMKIVFNGQSHNSIEFDGQAQSDTEGKANNSGPGEVVRTISLSRKAMEMSQEEELVVFEMQARRAANEHREILQVDSPREMEFEDISPVSTSLRYSWGQKSFLPVPKQI